MITAENREYSVGIIAKNGFTKRTLKVIIIFFTLILSLIVNIMRAESQAYAYTFSLGYGYGIIRYTNHFYSAPDIIQQSVIIHEFQHLEDGTLCFWDKNYYEIRAYRKQLEWLSKTKKELLFVFEKTKNSKVLKDYEIILDYETEIIHILKSF